MAFDAAMLAVILAELRETAVGAKIEKIYQPEQDEIRLAFRAGGENRRLLINAGANNPRLGLTDTQKENPMTAPMFCMLLRKHLGGARLASVEQPGFERVAILTFDTRDEMGFATQRCIIAEIMGKYSNLIFTDADRRVLAVLRPVDFTTSRKRQVLPGMRYELPPPQDKRSPLDVTEAEFAAYAEADESRPADKWLTATFLGLAAVTAREIVYRATRHVDTPLHYVTAGELWASFDAVMAIVRGDAKPEPTMARDGGRPVEYSFLRLTQYGDDALTAYPDTGSLLDAFFGARDQDTRVKQRAADVLHLLTSAQSRITRKLGLQREELADCARGAEYKADGDLITANLWQLSRGMKQVALTDYSAEPDESGSYPTRTITLDERLSPSQNAQRLYKRYNKAKTAEVELARQIALAEAEMEYLASVEDALKRAETDQDLAEIRDELHHAGYASRMKAAAQHRKQKAPVAAQFRTDDGLRVLCGKNNIQNEYITHKLAGKDDYWFHVKGQPGSHVVLFRGEGEPTDRDFTQAAEIAAYHSGAADGQNVAVDYTLARHVKKPASGKPGLVIYHTNWTAYVTPVAETIKRLRV